jgi:site-specific recombinase XerD
MLHSIDMKKDPLHYPEQTIKDFLTSTQIDLRTKRIMALAYATGSRVSELNKITKEDIKEEKGYMYISCKVLKKRTIAEQSQKRIAVIRLDNTVVVNHIRQLANITDEHKPLVPYSRVSIYRWLKAATGINPHMFRAIRATHLAKGGYTAHQLKHFFGWSSVAPSDYYVRLNTDDLEY